MAAANVLSSTRLNDRRRDGTSPVDRQRSLLPNRQQQTKFSTSSARIEAESKTKVSVDFTKVDIPCYRNTNKHNVCLELLKNGNHESFRELVALIDKQKEDRERAGKDSGHYYDPLLENEDAKLHQLKVYLSAAEDGKRNGDLELVYTSLNSLAEYFEEANDIWLADHFHKRCLETSLLIKNDGRRREGEAHCNMGLSYESKGAFSDAARHFEHFYALTKSNEWYTNDGQNLLTLASDCLRRIYTAMAEEVVDHDGHKAIQYLLKAYEMAKEVDTETEGLASYRLGNAYEFMGDSKTAIHVSVV
jgi:tetratricopeptide (TPR) repeat protein